MTDIQNNIRLSPRLVMLWNQSHLEAGFGLDAIPDPYAEPRIALYPASFIERVEQLGFAKTRDFNFRGALYIDEVTQRNRQWVLDFAKAHFTESSFFQVTDRNARRRNWLLQRRHKILGPYDRTFKQSGFVPKERPVKERDFFDDDYFRLMCSSKFTLCPAGDAPWSMRFYEAIMSKSLPIVECRQHTGRNALEYDIGYRYYRLDDPRIEYRADWVEENFRTFLRFQTLTEKSPENRRAESEAWPDHAPRRAASGGGSV
ncbi:exostosin domain-containing protein [Thiocapsa bogorovii]|uniref:exostosin domain-containing protein n=1 Tax=Thiocapsa bogorovii TaxID=521689 RepID=UPI001E564409|nr:exostosin family protein [Thiocapsa bogorovii]UHD17127.1 glycosyltransferase family 47 protein [Thiocapsa bogorovii]